MLNIPENFFLKILNEIDVSPILSLNTTNIIDFETINLILNENFDTVLKLLKIRLILIYKNKSTFSDFDLNKLLQKLFDTNYMNKHDIIMYALLLQNSSNVLKELTKNSYEYLMKCLNDPNKNSVLDELEIIDVVLQVSSLTKHDYFIKFDEEYKFDKVLLQLMSFSEKDIQKKIVIDVIPKYVQYTDNHNIFSNIWEKYQDNAIMDDLILNGLEEYFIPPIYTGKEFTILKQNNFWIKLQLNICDSNQILKRQSIYLLKQAIRSLLLNESYKEIFTSESLSSDMIIKWDANFTHEYELAWKNFFILCETSNEKTLHLIEPTLKLYNSLKPLQDSWRLCITKLFIQHPHATIVSYTVNQILILDWFCDVKNLAIGLNNNFLFESNESTIENNLNIYISKLIKEDLGIFLNIICEIQPSPIPFYFIMSALENFTLPEPNLALVSKIINASKNIPHKYIRRSVQQSISIFFINNEIAEDYITNETFIEELIKTIYSFYEIEFLQTNTGWTKMKCWMNKNKEVSAKVAQYILRKITRENLTDLIRGFTVFIALCIDTNILSWSRIKELYKNICQRIDKLCAKLNYLLFISLILKIFRELSILGYDIETNDIFNMLHTTFTICYTIDPDKIEFFNHISTILNLMYHTDNIKSRIDLINSFMQQLINNKKYICCLILSKQLLELYPLYNSNCDKDLDKVRYLEQTNNLKKNIKTAKHNYQSCNLILDNNTKRQLLTNYYHTMIKLHGIILEINCCETCDINDLIKINKYFDKGGPDIISSILDILSIIIKQLHSRKVSEEFVCILYALLERCHKETFHFQSNKLFQSIMFKFINIISYPFMEYYITTKNLAVIFCENVFISTQISSIFRLEILRLKKSKISSNILVEALLYGPLLRKDQRIEFDTCEKICNKFPEIDPNIKNPSELDRKVRVEGIYILLELLQKNSPEERCNILLELMNKYEKVSGKRYYANSQIHLLKLRIIQALHLLVPELPDTDLLQLKTQFFNFLINESNQTNIKILIQWLLIKIITKLKNINECILELINNVEKLKRGNVISIFPLFYHLLKNNDTDFNIVDKIMKLLLSNTMGQHFNIRYYAQMTIKHIYEVYKTKTEFQSSYTLIYDTVCDVINDTVTEKSMDTLLPFINLESSIETIYYDLPRLSNVTHTEWIPITYFTDNIDINVDQFIETFYIKYKIHLKNSNDTLKLINVPVNKTLTSNLGGDTEEGTTVQKKIDAYMPMFNNDKKQNAKGNLIVIASLITCEPNLGGLSRTCEVFGVKQYVVNNIQLLKNREYQSLSKSSEKWINTIEVRLPNLPTYLKELKKQGYKIVGAEQTSDSKNLNNYTFQKDTVLVLGNEREGIPPNLIHILDDCIEIPQYGQIRSLNVHVTGSICIWEYVKQHFC